MQFCSPVVSLPFLAVAFLAAPAAAQSAWSAPANISRSSQPPSYPDIRVDADGNVHAFFRAIPGTGGSQVWHVVRPYGGTGATSWSAPTLVSTPGAPSQSAFVDFVVEDDDDRMLCVFTQNATLFATQLDVRRPTAGWSTPARVSGPGGAQYWSRLTDRNGTLHLFFVEVPAAGGRQVWHAARPPGGAFSAPVPVSAPGIAPARFAWAGFDGSGALHVLYEQAVGARPAQLFWRWRPASSGTFSIPVDVSRAPQPATFDTALLDARDTLHVFFRAIPGSVGAAQLYHAHRTASGSFAAPVLVSTPGSASFGAIAQRLFADSHGRVHAVFHQIGGGGTTNQVWHTELDEGNPGGGWSSPTNVSGSSQPAYFQDMLVDPNGAAHVLFTSIPGVGGNQVFHAFRERGRSWSAPAVVSSPGHPFQSAVPRILRFDSRSRRVQCTWLQHPNGSLITQYWLREFDVDRPLQGWAPAINVSRAAQPVHLDRFLVDGHGGLHLLFDAIPGLGGRQLYHAHRPAGGAFGTPVIVTTPGGTAPSALVAFEFDRVGDLDVLFEQVGGGSSVAQLWSRRFDVDAPAGGWSAPVRVSNSSQPASFAGYLYDNQNTLHAFYRAIPGLGAAQLYHARRLQPKGPWSAPVLLSTPGSTSFGVGVAQYAEGPTGGVHVFFQQIGPSTGIAQIWHTTTDAHLSCLADRISIPLPAGGAQTLRCRAGTKSAGSSYLVLGSASGTSPGLVQGNLLLPLNPDDYTVFTLTQPNTWPWSRSAGTLDPRGEATATFGLPPGLPPGLAGLVLHHAFVVFGPSGVTHVSNAVPVRLTAR